MAELRTLIVPSFILSNISSPVFSCVHMSAGSRLSNVWFLALMRKNCWSHEAAPGRTLMRVIWKLQHRWPLAKREWTRTGEAGGEAQVRVFSLSLEDYGSRAVCKDSPAWMQLPWLLGGKRCTQLSEECACDDGVCDRGIRIPGEHLSLLINQVVQRLPLCSRVWVFCGRSKPIKRKFY